MINRKATAAAITLTLFCAFTASSAYARGGRHIRRHTVPTASHCAASAQPRPASLPCGLAVVHRVAHALFGEPTVAPPSPSSQLARNPEPIDAERYRYAAQSDSGRLIEVTVTVNP
jgi:hypothetical protein